MYKDSGLKFPKAYAQISSDDALVMSYEEGYRFDDKENLQKQNIDFNEIISKLVDFYTTQMLINGYFHADPHPGNLLVNDKGELILLDFGMVKSIPNNTRIAIFIAKILPTSIYHLVHLPIYFVMARRAS